MLDWTVELKLRGSDGALKPNRQLSSEFQQEWRERVAKVTDMPLISTARRAQELNYVENPAAWPAPAEPVALTPVPADFYDNLASGLKAVNAWVSELTTMTPTPPAAAESQTRA
jgi:hypothetical protein